MMAALDSDQTPRIGLIGAGAVGCVLALHLAESGRCQLSLLARERDAARWQTLPQLRLRTAAGERAQPRPRLCTAGELAQMDYLLLCVKQTQLDAALDALPPLPAHCTLVSTLNGPAALARIRARRPGQRLLAMPVMFNAQLLAPLHAQLSTTPRVLIAREETALRRAFAGSAMRVGRSHGEPSLWGKLLINLANAIGALTHTGFAELLTQRELRRAYVQVLDEAVAVLEASGTAYALPMPLPFSLYRRLLAGRSPLPWWFARLRNGLRAGAYPSMVADLAQGRDTEVRELNGAIVQLAQQLGRDAPANRRLCELVEARRGQAPPVYLSAAALLAALAPN
ncbi:2-dehydropantoate 2-reductase [Solimonas aquatica]|uniref:2-dehydropantoate 2-reductase n=1 Tax=Solimonas aquatica TaxID=489703 RepID=A0A1H8ZFY1_9GAMM|nr:ketopantoate reductase C-terminal domain-containing protein [Solimonas aquatica]SEP63303.1 2-dehydropantoate 2-reductase [Solimonas aquatica]